MTTYVRLPPVAATAVADTTGVNPGNWSVVLQQSDYSINVPYFELSHLCITDATPGMYAQLVIGGKTYGGAPINSAQGIEEYDPTNPPVIIPGNEIWVLFGNAPAAGTSPPNVTTFFRFDIDIPANTRYAQQNGMI